MPIRVLSPLLVNQIAAGEVIERPANVVKELVENALDAGASRIVVSIEAGGRELIEIVDDGHGIPADELQLAVAPHATSKIASSDDLARIQTLGFRGEALASIGSVSRLRIVSRTGDAESAASIAVEGDLVEPVRPASGAPGTTVAIRNLFFNTPARRKFLKSDSTEAGRIAEMFSTIAMAHPSVAFRLRQDGRVTLDLAPASPRSRVTAIVGGDEPDQFLDAVDAMTAVDAVAGGEPGAAPTTGAWLRVWGVVGTPAMARHNGRYVRLFLNGRPIVDRTVAHAVREAYRGLIDPTRFPTAAIFLTADPSEVDVNVHPAKSEVRFRNVSAVHSMVHATVKAALRKADLVPALELGADAPEALDPTPMFGGAHDRAASAGEPAGPVGPTHRGGFGSSPGWARTASPGFSLAAARGALAEPPPDLRPAPEAASFIPTPSSAVRVLQIHDKYVVVEDPEGMMVIDQHALHERVMFEKLHRRFVAGSLESQRLLVPADISADAARLEALERVRGLLLRLGIDAEPSGPASIAIHAFPSALFGRRVEPVAFLVELLDRAASTELPPSEEAALVAVLSMMACKAAIKAGDRLTPGELDELLRLRETVERSTACPHGRPTSLRVTLKDLDRQFGR